MSGDGGHIVYEDKATNRLVTFFTSTGGSQGGHDTLTGGTGLDILFGGTGNDKLFGKDGDGFLAGDDAWIGFESQSAKRLVTAFNTTGGQIGGDDELTGGSGLDVLLGGAGSDKLLGKENTGFLAGDCAEIVFETNSAARLAKYFYTTDYGVKGNDELTGGSGIDILFGGSGADQIVGGGGYNMLAGDGARVDFQSNSQQRTVQRFMTTGGAHGGPSSPFRVSVCAARTLDAPGQSRVTLSLQLEHLRAAC